MAKQLTDFEVVNGAEKLIFDTSIKSRLPYKYTLVDLAEANEAMALIAKKYLLTYGERLKALSPAYYRELGTW
ncbi:hypothetical protein OAK87_00585 [bacterium]|nr:hypothetical protein [bacterium]